jgi:hypothetical protein
MGRSARSVDQSAIVKRSLRVAEPPDPVAPTVTV